MKTLLVTLIGILFAVKSYSQHSLKIIVRDDEKKPLAGATLTIKPVNRTSITDSLGVATFNDLAPGEYSLSVSFVGFEEVSESLNIPRSSDEPFEITLEPSEEEEEEVIITSTRTSRSIKDVPTRVEIISGEELGEKANMKPGDIRMLLNESTGIQTQQTSATSYNSSIRIQGLDGRYTQILRDGFPLYSGFSGGLSLMQIAPLDLKQVEVIKGSSSTLYGGGAIAGLVNLVSKTPQEERDLSLLINGTSAKGLDLSGFYSQRFERIGVTVFASRNSSAAYDPADIGLTAIPEYRRYTINPRVFLYGNKTTGNFGISYITEDRLGGSMNYIKNGSGGYFEQNDTKRFTTQFELQHKFNDHLIFNFKNSKSRFKREITIPATIFEGLQQSSFSEITINYNRTQTVWIAGINLLTDKFDENRQSAAGLRDYNYTTIGGFIQNTLVAGKTFSLETGLRADYVEQFGLEILPRVSFMFRPGTKFTARIGGGFGYKTPTVFNEESERLHFLNILAIEQDSVSNERSLGFNVDLNYRTTLGDVGFTINQLFFYTRLNKPLVLETNFAGFHEFRNANGHIDTRGLETNLRFTYHNFKLFLGYTFADVNTHFNNTKGRFPLTAKHRLNNVLMYEKEEKLKIGLEAYYFSPQILTDGTKGKSYWIHGFMMERLWEKFSVYINFENFTDTRQTRFDTIYSGNINNPIFRDIYAPVDGFVINGGIKVKL